MLMLPHNLVKIFEAEESMQWLTYALDLTEAVLWLELGMLYGTDVA